LVAGKLDGEEVDIEVTVQSVKEQELPVLDDEFAQNASEFDTVEELTADLRSRLERLRRVEQAATARDVVLAKLLEMADIPLPESTVAEEIKARKDHVSGQLEDAGMSFNDYLDAEDESEEDFDAHLEERVRGALASQFMLDELAKQQQLSVAEQELTEHLIRHAQRSGMQPDAYAKQVMESGQIPELVGEVVRAKALQLVVESAEVTDTAGQVIDLKRLKPDGTLMTEEEFAAATSSEEAEGDVGSPQDT
jgi:trigger factor